MCVWTQYYNARCEYASSEYVSTRLRRARVRRRTTETVPSSSVSKSLYDEKMSKRRLAWGSLAASQVAKTGHLRILLDTTSLIEREYDDTCDSCCVSVGLPLSSSFYSFTRTTTTPSFQRTRRENTRTNEDDTLFMRFLFYSPYHRHRLLGTYHLAFASSVSNVLVFFPEDDFDDDEEEAEPRLLLLLLLLNVNEKYTVAAKNARTTAFPSIAPGGFRKLIASRPSLNAIFLCVFTRKNVKSVTHQIRKDVLLLFRLLE